MRVAVVRLPRLSNVTDIDALAATSPAWWCGSSTRSPDDLADADPGDHGRGPGPRWPTWRGCATAAWRTRWWPGRRPVGRCSGSAVATRCWPGRSPTTSSRARAPSTALALLPGARCASARDKDARPARSLALPYGETVAHGYEIHHGVVAPLTRGHRVRRRDATSGVGLKGTSPGTGCWSPTSSAGPFSPTQQPRPGCPRRPGPTCRSRRCGSAAWMCSGDLVADHLDTAALMSLIENGAPPDQPVIASSLAERDPDGAWRTAPSVFCIASTCDQETTRLTLVSWSGRRPPNDASWRVWSVVRSQRMNATSLPSCASWPSSRPACSSDRRPCVRAALSPAAPQRTQPRAARTERKPDLPRTRPRSPNDGNDPGRRGRPLRPPMVDQASAPGQRPFVVLGLRALHQAEAMVGCG